MSSISPHSKKESSLPVSESPNTVSVCLKVIRAAYKKGNFHDDKVNEGTLM